jgi:FMN phosphatase YigB (HAD superfamily)
VTDGISPVLHEILEKGRTQSGYRVEELWTQYLALGGNEPMDKINAFLDGSSVPSRRDYDLLVHCLNERGRELGTDDPLPYGDDLGL